MNGVGVDELCGADDLIDLEITLSRTRGTDTDGLIRELYVSRVAIRVATDDDGFDA